MMRPTGGAGAWPLWARADRPDARQVSLVARHAEMTLGDALALGFGARHRPGHGAGLADFLEGARPEAADADGRREQAPLHGSASAIDIAIADHGRGFKASQHALAQALLIGRLECVAGADDHGLLCVLGKLKRRLGQRRAPDYAAPGVGERVTFKISVGRPRREGDSGGVSFVPRKRALRNMFGTRHPAWMALCRASGEALQADDGPGGYTPTNGAVLAPPT